MKFSIPMILGLATTLCAQGPNPAGTPNPAGATDAQTYLSLSDSQVQALKQLREQERQVSSPMLQQMRQKQQSLESQLSAGGSAASVGQLMLDLQTLRGSLSTTRTSYYNQAVNLLTADQKTKLQTLENAAALRPAIGEASALGLMTRGASSAGGPGPGSMWRHGGPRGRFGGPPPAPPAQN